MMAFGKALVRAGITVAAGGLAGCVVLPPASLQVPYVAVPGPTKTEAQFRQEDMVCRVAAVQLPPGPGGTEPAGPAPGQVGAGSQAIQRQAAQAQARPQALPEAAALSEPPGVTYLRCMAARNNLIVVLRPELQSVHAYYPAYPIYAGGSGYGSYDPWLYWAGLYGVYGGGFGGWRGGYGYRGFGGGYRDGGFRGGEGGFRGGGFRH